MGTKPKQGLMGRKNQLPCATISNARLHGDEAALFEVIWTILKLRITDYI